MRRDGGQTDYNQSKAANGTFSHRVGGFAGIELASNDAYCLGSVPDFSGFGPSLIRSIVHAFNKYDHCRFSPRAVGMPQGVEVIQFGLVAAALVRPMTVTALVALSSPTKTFQRVD